MKQNMGTIDRVVRAIVAVVAVVLIFTGQLTGVWAIIVGVLAAVFALTSLVGFCPLYVPFGIRTCRITQ